MQELTLLGLTDREILLYQTINETGIMSPRELAHLLSLNRSAIYEHLEKLIQVGLVVEVTSEKKKYFQAVSIKGVTQLIRSRIKELENLEKKLPDLIKPAKLPKKLKPKSNTQLYRGISGMRMLVEEVARAESDVYLIGSIKGLHHYLGLETMEKIYTKVRRRHIHTDYLIADWATSTVRRFFEESGVFTKVRFLPPELEPKGVFVAFDHKLIVAEYFPQPFACVFTEPSLIAMYKMAFWNLWHEVDGKNLPPQPPDLK